MFCQSNRVISVCLMNISKHKRKIGGTLGTTVVGLSLFAKKDGDDLNYLWTDGNISTFMAEPITNRDVLKKENRLMRHRMELFILGIQRDVFMSLKKFEQDAYVQHEQNGDILAATEVRRGDNTLQQTNKLEDMIIVDRWQREEGGGGISCLIQNGRVFEKVNYQKRNDIFFPYMFKITTTDYA